MSPLPGRRNTLATARLRRPVPRCCTNANVTLLYSSTTLPSPLAFARRAGVWDPHTPSASGTSVSRAWSWEACLNRFLHHARRPRFAHRASLGFRQPARIAGMAPVKLLLFLAPGQPDLGGVHHDHMIAGVQKRRVSRAYSFPSMPARLCSPRGPKLRLRHR